MGGGVVAGIFRDHNKGQFSRIRRSGSLKSPSFAKFFGRFPRTWTFSEIYCRKKPFTESLGGGHGPPGPPPGYATVVYCRTSDDMHVDTTWMTLFSQMSCIIENIPPTQAASDQRIKSSSYQSGHLWGQSLNFQTILIGNGRHPKLPVIFLN